MYVFSTAVYIGENASLSFLDFLRHSLKQLVGATAFTDAQPQSFNLMLESDMDQVPESDMNLSIQEKNALFSSYSAVVCLHFYRSDHSSHTTLTTLASLAVS